MEERPHNYNGINHLKRRVKKSFCEFIRGYKNGTAELPRAIELMQEIQKEQFERAQRMRGLLLGVQEPMMDDHMIDDNQNPVNFYDMYKNPSDQITGLGS